MRMTNRRREVSLTFKKYFFWPSYGDLYVIVSQLSEVVSWRAGGGGDRPHRPPLSVRECLIAKRPVSDSPTARPPTTATEYATVELRRALTTGAPGGNNFRQLTDDDVKVARSIAI